MTLSRKILVIAGVGFLLNFPLISLASHLTLTQTVNPGPLLLLEMPSDVSLPPLTSQPFDQTNYAIPDLSGDDGFTVADITNGDAPVTDEVGLDSTNMDSTNMDGTNIDLTNSAPVKAGKIILVKDLRFKGGFSLQMTITRPTEVGGAGFIPIENIGVVTFHENEEGSRQIARAVEGTPQVMTPLNGDPKVDDDYVMLTASETDPEVSVPVTVFDAPASVDQGRLGTFETCPAFKLILPADLPAGRYVSSFTYTFIDVTVP